jgi:uncharacterized protein (TIGR02001 family)
MKKSLLILALLSAGIVQAQVTTNLGATSDYRFRGISQTQNAPALQGGIDYADKSGFYVGNWNSSVSSQLYTNGSGLESDLYAGYKKEVVGVTLDVGSYNYFYPRASVGKTNYDTKEVYLGAAKGPVSVKVSQSLGDYFATSNSRGTRYYQADVAYPIAGTKASVLAHAGKTDIANNTTLDYNDYNFGLGYNIAGFDVSAKYYTNSNKTSAFQTANTLNGQKLYKNAAVLSVSKTF